MTKRSRSSRKAPQGDLSFCYEMQFQPEGVRFSQIDTPYSVVINLCPEHAGQFLFHIGNVFTKLPEIERRRFNDCVLLFAEHMLKHPYEYQKYEFHADAENYLSYLTGKMQADDQEAACYEQEALLDASKGVKPTLQ